MFYYAFSIIRETTFLFSQLELKSEEDDSKSGLLHKDDSNKVGVQHKDGSNKSGVQHKDDSNKGGVQHKDDSNVFLIQATSSPDSRGGARYPPFFGLFSVCLYDMVHVYQKKKTHLVIY